MRKIDLLPEPLTASRFAEFGDVISANGASYPINGGTTQRFHRQATVERNDGEAIISVFQAQPRSLPMKITMMERHPLGSQAFLPCDDQPYLVLVCLGDNAPDPDTLRLFSVQGQGVNYHAGTWHYPLLSLENVRNFWIVDRIGHGNNLDENPFSDDVEITISEYRSHSE